MGIWAVESSNVLFQFNESHHNKNGTGTADGGGLDFDGGCRDCIAQYNYTHNNDGPAMLSCQYTGCSDMQNLTWRYNISINDGLGHYRYVIDMYNGATALMDNIVFYNNLVYKDSGGGTLVNLTGTNVRYFNNIFLTKNGKQIISSGLSASCRMMNNLYYAYDNNLKIIGSYTTLAAFRTAYTANGQQVTLIPDNSSGIGGYLTITRTDLSPYGYLKMTPASNDIRIYNDAFDQRGAGFPRKDGSALDMGSIKRPSGITTYTVTYNGNGNTGGVAPVDGNSPYQANATVTVLGNTGGLVRTGYTFSGWNTAANGSGTSYQQGATFAINANTTLYAQWTINTYTLTYTAGEGGSLTGATSQQVNHGGSGTEVTAI